MKRHGIGFWFGIVAATVVGLFVTYVLAWLFVWVPTHARQTRRMVFEADHPALLSACRFMISNRQFFTNDWSAAVEPGEIGMSEEQIKNNPHVPASIRQMHPLCICLERERVIATLHGPPRMYFIGYAEGAQEDGTERLLEGLWYFNGKWQTRQTRGQSPPER